MNQVKSKKWLSFLGWIAFSLVTINWCQATETNPSFNGEMPLSETELSNQSGQGMESFINRSSANLNHNGISVGAGGSLNNGNNSLSDQAFSGVDGIPTVVQNSGNNVIIQNSTIVNMSFQ